MNVVPATRTDAEALAALHRQCFDEPWDAAAFDGLLATSETFAFAAPSHEWQAFVICRAAAGEAEILSLGMVPAARGRGLGRFLVAAAAVEAVHRGAIEMFLEVAADNAAAVELYSALGFIQVGRRTGYYVRPSGAVDALTLRAKLPLSGAFSAQCRGAGERG